MLSSPRRHAGLLVLVALLLCAPAPAADAAAPSVTASIAKGVKPTVKAERHHRKAARRHRHKAARKHRHEAAHKHARRHAAKLVRAAADPDRDGLNNRGERQAGLNPHRADTDRDGILDGAEHTGVVSAVEGDAVTIRLFGGGRLTARLDADTELACVGGDDVAGDTGDDLGDDSADDLGDDVAAQAGDDTADAEPVDHAADDAGDEDLVTWTDDPCSAAVAVGARVYEAATEDAGNGLIFTTFDTLG